MKIKQNIILAFLIIAAVFLVVGCADRSKELLAEDFKKMGNEDLLRYFYRLNDEIESQEKQSGPQVGFGIGGFGGQYCRRCRRSYWGHRIHSRRLEGTPNRCPARVKKTGIESIN